MTYQPITAHTNQAETKAANTRRAATAIGTTIATAIATRATGLAGSALRRRAGGELGRSATTVSSSP
jgi:hypothetical protein